MVNPTIAAAATATLEATINKALHYDPATRLALSQLQEKSLAVDFTDLHTSLCLHFDEQVVRVTTYSENPTTRLRGSVVGLARLVISDTATLTEANVEAWGSTALLAEPTDGLVSMRGSVHWSSGTKLDCKNERGQSIDVDWEDALSHWMGDVVGHQLAQTIRWRLRLLVQHSKSTKRLVQEFLTEELAAIPTQVELQNFSNGVDEIRLAADRIDAKLAAVMANIQQNNRRDSDDPKD